MHNIHVMFVRLLRGTVCRAVILFLFSCGIVLICSCLSRVYVSFIYLRICGFRSRCFLAALCCVCMFAIVVCLAPMFSIFWVSLFQRSTSPPGGNQVDGLPPALSLGTPTDQGMRLTGGAETCAKGPGHDAETSMKYCHTNQCSA